MLYSNRFAGHLAAGDPRTPLAAAGGCPWPTVPPYRMQFSSLNPTGQFEFLLYTPVILQLIDSPVQHSLATWEAIEQPPIVYSWTVYKVWSPTLVPDWDYQMVILLNGWPAEVPYAKDIGGPCNVDVVWGDISIPYGTGSPGSLFTQFQVEYNQTRHPNWMPPT